MCHMGIYHRPPWRGPYSPISPGLRHIVYGDPKRLYSFRLTGPALERLSAAAEAFVAAQLERGFRTLEFYKSLQPPEELSK